MYSGDIFCAYYVALSVHLEKTDIRHFPFTFYTLDSLYIGNCSFDGCQCPFTATVENIQLI
jgi:hypothetical protein